MIKKIAVIGAVMDHPRETQHKFNDVLGEYKSIIKGRMGIPFEDEDISIVSITVMGSLDEINSLTGKLGNIKGVIVKTSISKGDYHMKKLIDKLYHNNDLSRDELITLIKNLDEDSTKYLNEKSLATKTAVYGNTVYMRGLIEISSYCSKNCVYCGIRAENTSADRYRLKKDEILACAREGDRLGYKTFVLQGGEDAYYSDEVLVDIITSIKKEFPDSAITLSLGERTYESYKKLFEAGADRYLLRHETASVKLYESLHPDMNFYNRVKCLYNLQEIGFQVGAGCMVGLPNQTIEDMVEDLIFLKKLKPHMVGIGPYIPHKETPIGGNKGGTVEMTTMMLSLVRLLLPEVLLPSTTALGTIDPLGREKALKVGANVVMPNLSPMDVREMYELYDNKICTGDEAAHCRSCIEGRINNAGFVVDMGRGDHASRSIIQST